MVKLAMGSPSAAVREPPTSTVEFRINTDFNSGGPTGLLYTDSRYSNSTSVMSWRLKSSSKLLVVLKAASPPMRVPGGTPIQHTTGTKNCRISTYAKTDDVNGRPEDLLLIQKGTNLDSV